MSWFKKSIRRVRRHKPQANEHKPQADEKYYENEEWGLRPESTEASLLREDWYHGTLPREGVHALLHGDGEFLVRRSKNPDTDQPWYVISVKFTGGYKHYTIQGEEGRWRLRGTFRSTIPEIIRELELSGDPVTGTGDVRLKQAVPLQDWELRHDDIQLHDLLGKGHNSETRRATLKRGKAEVAVKVISNSTPHSQLIKENFHEAFTLRQLDHPNIVQFVGIAVLRQPFMIAMEYAPGGDLLTYLRDSNTELSQKKKLQICLNVVSGMTHFEAKNIVHRDLAARNCLVGRDEVIKISDFTDSVPNDHVFVSGQIRLPIKWCAPELFNTGHFTFACDVWSFGILMTEVFSQGRMPYPGMTNHEAREKIEEGYRMPAPGDTPNEVYKIMMSCWEAQAEERPDAQTLHNALSYLYEQ